MEVRVLVRHHETQEAEGKSWQHIRCIKNHLAALLNEMRCAFCTIKTEAILVHKISKRMGKFP